MQHRVLGTRLQGLLKMDSGILILTERKFVQRQVLENRREVRVDFKRFTKLNICLLPYGRLKTARCPEDLVPSNCAGWLRGFLPAEEPLGRSSPAARRRAFFHRMTKCFVPEWKRRRGPH